MPPPSALGTGLAGILARTGSQKGLNLQGQAGKASWAVGTSNVGQQTLGHQTLGHHSLVEAGTELELDFGLKEDFISKGRIRPCKSRVGEGVKTGWD